jgi:hypothetical protein
MANKFWTWLGNLGRCFDKKLVPTDAIVHLAKNAIPVFYPHVTVHARVNGIDQTVRIVGITATHFAIMDKNRFCVWVPLHVVRMTKDQHAATKQGLEKWLEDGEFERIHKKLLGWIDYADTRAIAKCPGEPDLRINRLPVLDNPWYLWVVLDHRENRFAAKVWLAHEVTIVAC